MHIHRVRVSSTAALIVAAVVIVGVGMSPQLHNFRLPLYPVIAHALLPVLAAALVSRISTAAVGLYVALAGAILWELVELLWLAPTFAVGYGDTLVDLWVAVVACGLYLVFTNARSNRRADDS